MQERFVSAPIFVLGFAALMAAPLAAEGMFAPSRTGDVQLRRGLTEAEAKAAIISLREQNRMVIDVEVTSHSSDCAKNDTYLKSETCHTFLKYDLLSEPNPSGRRWDLNIGESPDAYAKSWKDNSAKGWRLMSLEPRSIHTFTGSGPLAKKVAFASLWADDPAKIGWVSFSRLSSAEFSEKFKEFAEGKQMAVTSYASYDLVGANCDKALNFAHRCIAVTFAKDPGGRKFAFMRGLTPDAYTEQREKYEKGGFRTLLLSNGEKMATSFIKDDSADKWESRSRLSAAEFDKTDQQMRQQGWRLVDFEAAQMNGEKDANFNGSRIYGGVWLKPAPAPRLRP
jgi:Bacterial tandem repeat domain 1